MLLEKGLFQRQDLRKNSASVFSSQVSVLGAGLGLGGDRVWQECICAMFLCKIGWNRWRICSEELGYFLLLWIVVEKYLRLLNSYRPNNRGTENLFCIQAVSCSDLKGHGQIVVLMYSCYFPFTCYWFYIVGYCCIESLFPSVLQFTLMTMV